MGLFGNEQASRMERRCFIYSGRNRFFYVKNREIIMFNRKQILLIAFIFVIFLIQGCSEEGSSEIRPVSIINSSENIYKMGSKDEDIVVSEIIDEYSQKILMTYDGGYERLDDDGKLEVGKEGINFKNLSGEIIYENVVGIIENPPERSIMDVYYKSKEFLNEDKKVMIIFIDGFGWHQYEYLKENNSDLYIMKLEGFEKALSVYKPVTNSGYAAMITGKPPYINGILNRDYREVKVDTIFNYIESIGKEAVLIEGNSNIITTGIDPILNLDLNGNGYNDDEVHQSALNNIDKKDYVFVHFHGFDDSGHSYGPLGKETVDKIIEIDKYVEELVSKWKGKVIITADHGMHEVEKGGSHGEFRYEDIIVPFGIFEGGQN